MKALFTTLGVLAGLAAITNGQDTPASETRVEPAVPVAEPVEPEPAPPDPGGAGPESAAPSEEIIADDGPSPEKSIAPVAPPDSPAPDREREPRQPAPAAPAESSSEAAAPPVLPPSKDGKPLDWEKNIVRVSILDDMRPITIPVEGAEAMGKAADSKLPRVVSPYAPKALSPVPEGWQLYTDTSVPVRIHRVKFKDGRTLDIGVFPPALMPANPDATTVVLPQSAGNLLGAIGSAREAQSQSKAKIESLLEAINRQLPPLDPESPPMP
jgi:hypothetical protein